MKKIILLALLGAALPAATTQAETRNCAAHAATATDTAFHGGTRFSVQIQGQDGADVQDVILIPGLSTPREVWAETAAAQRGCYRLHLVQIYGFGDAAGANAEGPILEPFVRELADYISDHIIATGRAKPAIIGHSLGGLSALMIAARYPDLPGKIMIVDAVPYIGTIFFPGATVDVVRPRAETFAASIRAEYGRPTPIDTGKDPGLQSQAGGLTNHPAGRISVARWTMKSDPRVVAQALFDDMTTDMRPELSKITAPVTLLYAQDDRAMTPAQATAAFVPQYAGTAKLNAVQVTGSFHFIMLDQPEKFRDEMTKFLSAAD